MKFKTSGFWTGRCWRLDCGFASELHNQYLKVRNMFSFFLSFSLFYPPVTSINSPWVGVCVCVSCLPRRGQMLRPSGGPCRGSRKAMLSWRTSFITVQSPWGNSCRNSSKGWVFPLPHLLPGIRGCNLFVLKSWAKTLDVTLSVQEVLSCSALCSNRLLLQGGTRDHVCFTVTAQYELQHSDWFYKSINNNVIQTFFININLQLITTTTPFKLFQAKIVNKKSVTFWFVK